VGKQLRRYDVTVEIPEIFEKDFPNAQVLATELTTIGLRVLSLEPDPDNDLNEELPESWPLTLDKGK
jgi:hypothetical protein